MLNSDFRTEDVLALEMWQRLLVPVPTSSWQEECSRATTNAKAMLLKEAEKNISSSMECLQTPLWKSMRVRFISIRRKLFLFPL